MKEEIKDYYASWLGINGLYEKWAKEQGIHTETLFVLYTIWSESSFCSQKMISRMWQMPKQTVHSILKKLETQGMVYLVQSGEDKRNKQILFTEEGREYANGLIARLQAMEERVMERMGERDCRQFLNMNRKFLECLKMEIEGEVS